MIFYLSEAGCVLMVYILYVSGIKGNPTSICALSGSSVNLSCSASAANLKWYKGNGYNGADYQDVSADGNPLKFRISGSTLTIRNVTKIDEKFYCCCENTPKQTPDKTESCHQRRIKLQVTDLQVKVFPATEGQRVTLMCSTSCSLTESPAAFIWYQNSEFLYEDWSPWYRELVSSDPAVRYSCAIKGYENLTAPEVSVDSVTRSCFSVTYAGGTMCSYNQTSEKQPCSITFPTELYINIKDSSQGHFKLTCNSSCSQIDLQVLQLYRNTQDGLRKAEQNAVFTSSSIGSFLCSVKDPDYLLSNQVCLNGSNCWTVNYVNRRICGLKGSSVNISSKYSLPENLEVQAKHWYKVNINTKQEGDQLVKDEGDVKYQDNMINEHILRINNLDQKDSGEYKFRVKLQDDDLVKSVYPGVTLVVTELWVDLRPAAEVTEGQRVTLTCSTSCPLSENTNYIWYLNSQPLSLTKTHNKQLIIDEVSSQDEGNYSCAVETISSAAKTLTVQRRTANWRAAAAGASAALLVFIPLIFFMLWKGKTSPQSSTNESVNNTDEINLGHTYDEISAHPAEKELHYSQLAIEKLNPLYSSIQHQQEQEHTPYAMVKIGTNNNSD